MRTLFLFIAFTFNHVADAGEAPTPAPLQQWFEQDTNESTDQVNEGALHFLTTAPDGRILHSSNELTVDRNSLDNGWVKLAQCYHHLDAVAEAEVVYRYKFLRKLRIDSSHDIGSVRVVGQTVQLEHVGRDAQLCVQAEIRNFYQNPDGSFSLVNGPYHRKFLDGFYPYRISLKVHYPASLLVLSHSQPAPQAGFEVNRHKGSVNIETLFEGILNIELVFRPQH